MNSSSLKNKIQSDKGATIVFALFALIVSVMISAVVIYTAFSNVGRVKNTQNEEQNYLSVSSAVKLFKESLAGDSVSYEETYVKTTTETYDENWETLISSTVSDETTISDAVYDDALPLNNMLKEVLNEWAKAFDSPVPKTLTITITGDSELPKIAAVEAVMVFDPVNNKLTTTFGIKDAPSAVDKFSTVMTMDLSKSTSYPVTSSMETKEQKNGSNIKTITVTKKVVHTINWDNCVIAKEK
ncbi:MAG: hypothetical protein ACOX4A_04390 [Saccharofermentanales bacterium]|jgi:hypothetical protein